MKKKKEGKLERTENTERKQRMKCLNIVLLLHYMVIPVCYLRILTSVYYFTNIFKIFKTTFTAQRTASSWSTIVEDGTCLFLL